MHLWGDAKTATYRVSSSPGPRKPPNLALYRTPATGRDFSFIEARRSVAGSAELIR